MRNMRNIMIEAHRMTREIKRTSPEVDYRTQLGLCLSFLMTNKKERVMEMAKLEGSEKQIKWAEDLRKEFVTKIEEYKEFLNNEEEEVILRHARYFSMSITREFKEFLLNLNAIPLLICPSKKIIPTLESISGILSSAFIKLTHK